MAYANSLGMTGAPRLAGRLGGARLIRAGWRGLLLQLVREVGTPQGSPPLSPSGCPSFPRAHNQPLRASGEDLPVDLTPGLQLYQLDSDLLDL